jgi:hypothetical protein
MLHELTNIDSKKVGEFDVAVFDRWQRLEAGTESIECDAFGYLQENVFPRYDLIFAEAALAEQDALDRAVFKGVVMLEIEIELN